MAPLTDLENTLRVLSKILFWCFVLGFLSLLLWFVAYITAADFIFEIHGDMFNITRHDIDIMNYYGMTYAKGTIFMLFLVPYIAVRLVLRGINKTDA
jgi:uncharacterized protein DUF6868